jgi:hypothetical protein
LVAGVHGRSGAGAWSVANVGRGGATLLENRAFVQMALGATVLVTLRTGTNANISPGSSGQDDDGATAPFSPGSARTLPTGTKGARPSDTL